MTYFGAKAFEEWFMSSPNIEYCSPTNLAVGRGKYSSECQGFVLAKKGEYMEVILNWTSADFFKIYEYDFIEGRPFTKKQVEAREKICVISEALAERLFGKDKEAKGQMVTMENGLSVRVTGVVRNGSQLTPDSYADLFLPYTLREDRYEINSPYTGHFSIVATVKDTEHLKALKQELAEIEARLTNNSSEILGWSTSSVEMGKKHVELGKDMETHPMHTRRRANGGDWYNKIPNSQLIYHFAGLLFVLLFVPALNLCGIVAGRMERRTAEMGIRKTFGARRSTLLWQVVTENLVLTSIGGIIGLVISWLAIYGFTYRGHSFLYHQIAAKYSFQKARESLYSSNRKTRLVLIWALYVPLAALSTFAKHFAVQYRTLRGASSKYLAEPTTHTSRFEVPRHGKTLATLLNFATLPYNYRHDCCDCRDAGTARICARAKSFEHYTPTQLNCRAE